MRAVRCEVTGQARATSVSLRHAQRRFATLRSSSGSSESPQSPPSQFSLDASVTAGLSFREVRVSGVNALRCVSMTVADRVARLSGASESLYETFAERCLAQNEPAIFDRSLVAHWRALGWVGTDGELELNALEREFGTAEVTVADCSTPEHDRTTRVLSSVLATWRMGEPNVLYVKDWHAQSSAKRAFYDTPAPFVDDWMQAYSLARTDSDYRFVYVGERGTWTGLHGAGTRPFKSLTDDRSADVYGSYSWSTNVVGIKRWLLWPPDQTHLLKHRVRDELPVDPRDVDPVEFPSFASSTPIEILQQAGETIFVPSGWHHAVYNETRCLSINRACCSERLL